MARAHAAAISNGLLQRVPQLVQQPEQLGVFLFRQQIGHIVVRLVEGEDGVFMEADALFRQHQLFQPGILRHALALDVSLALHQLQDVGHGGAGNGKLPLNVPLEHLLLPVPVKILDDPTVHRGGLLHTVGAGKLVDLAEEQVVRRVSVHRGRC